MLISILRIFAFVKYLQLWLQQLKLEISFTIKFELDINKNKWHIINGDLKLLNL